MIIVILLSLSSFRTFAYEGNQDIKPIYCPESITCPTNGNIDSCKIKYISDSKYFGKLSGNTYGATFTFASASAGFHSNSGGSCRYEYTFNNGTSV